MNKFFVVLLYYAKLKKKSSKQRKNQALIKINQNQVKVLQKINEKYLLFHKIYILKNYANKI